MDALLGNVLQINLLGFLAGFGTVIGAWALYRIRLMDVRVQSELERVRMELSSTSNGSLGIGKRLLEVEKKLQGKLAIQEEIEQGYSPYTKATQMLGEGSDLSDVIKTCGISRPEAELMQLMHRQMKRCGPTQGRK